MCLNAFYLYKAVSGILSDAAFSKDTAGLSQKEYPADLAGLVWGG